MMRAIKRFIRWLVFACLALAGLLAYYAYTPIKVEKLPFEFALKQGSGLRSAANQIGQAGGLPNEWLFVLLARTLGKAGQIKPGNYQISHEVSPLQLLRMISKGQVVQGTLTVVEGTTFWQLRAALNANPHLRHDSVSLSETEILQQIGATETLAEGLFFPDTYNFDRGSSDIALLKRAYRLMKQNLESSWSQRDLNLPFNTPYEALILASIVEKETGKASDRPMIASVFINRLRKNMRLQTDPTVIYGIGPSFDGNLRKKDLLNDTPYNTYTRNGLTPTPIALPGNASIQAVLHPATSQALYFVARGDGSSQFSNSLIEHNAAVKRYQLQ